MKTTVSNVRVSLVELASAVYQYGQYLKANFERADLSEDGDEDSSGGDFRLQVLPGLDDTPGHWRTWEGDSSFDTDHRGYWGASFVPYGCTRKEAKSIARDLINEAQDSAAMDSAE